MLQSVSSVFVVYRRKTLTGSLDPMHANGMDKPCRNMSTLVTPQCKMNKRKCHVCPSCLSYFVHKDSYETHIDLCKKGGTQYVFSEEGEAKLGFSSFNSMVNVPFVIYADLEMMICKEEMVRRGKTQSKCRHIPILVGALTVCKDRPEFGSAAFLYTGSDCIDMLMEFLNSEQHRARQIYKGVSMPCLMTNRDSEHFWIARACEMCGGKVWVRSHVEKSTGSLSYFPEVQVCFVLQLQFDVA